MNILRRTLAVSAVAALALSGATVVAQTKWDVPTSYAASIYHTQILQKLGQDIEKGTNGRIKPVVHANASLFKINEIKRAVQTEQAQMGELLVGLLENENKAFGVDTVPFLATNFSESRKLWEASRPVYEEILSKQGLKLLYSIPWPPNALLAKKPLNAVAELKGMKWRAYNPATSRFGELVGAQPVTVATVDLAQAVATGVVDVFATASPVAVQQKLYESMGYYYVINAWLPKNMVIVNARTFNALDKQAQEAVLKAGAEAEKRGWQAAEDEEKANLSILAKNGMKVLSAPPQLKADLDRIGKVMLDEWLAAAGADGRKVIDSYRKMH